MSFEIIVASNAPLVSEKDIEKVAKEFLTQIGYISKGSEPTIPLKLFLDCFLKRLDKAWLVDELALELNTSRPTVYRHLNKLKRYDILEELPVESENLKKKAYRLRYSNISKAWNFAEAHAKVALENYRKTVEHLQELVELYRKGK
ncbi:MAG: HTH domain-containing protein [Candidatus Thermoplasmatota archaeon]|nr:HTH domain-containing protein [Candidatus Thermoplasmatota archaeon]